MDQIRRLDRGQAGQAIVEYLLVLIVVVAIILGVMAQFSSAFRMFAENYFANYIGCLLEVGELPSLGGADSSGGVCDAQFAPFSLENGRPLVGNGINAGGQPGEVAGGNDAAGGKKSGAGRASDVGSGSSSSQSMGTLRNAGSGGARGGGGRGNSVEKDGKTYTGSTESSSTGRIGSLSRVERTTTKKTSIGNRYFGYEDEEEKKSAKPPVAKVGESGGNTLKPKVSKVETLRDLASKQANVDMEVGLGSMLRWLIIAAIVIALVIFLGGQALQISKSWES